MHNLEEKLIVGVKIRIGKIFSEQNKWAKEGEILQLVEGYFDYENGLYTETQTAPSIWESERKEFSSIYHLFGNDLEDFLDCEIVNK